MTKYFSDIDVGETRSYGSYEVTEAEIVSFGEQYDPQPFHTDPERAGESMFGELIASGWHTGSITMRLLADGIIPEYAALGAKGIDELRWVRPVRPGDTLSIRIEVLDKEIETPDRGLVRTRVETLDQHDEVVCSRIDLMMVARRPDGEDGSK